MIPVENRLKHMKDFEILFAEGSYVSGPLLTLKYWHIDPAKYPRRSYATTDLKIGFVVSTKVDKRAVVRNRLKRQMREVVRLLLKYDRVPRGCMMAFMAKPAMAGQEYLKIEEAIFMALRRAGLLQKEETK